MRFSTPTSPSGLPFQLTQKASCERSPSSSRPFDVEVTLDVGRQAGRQLVFNRPSSLDVFRSEYETEA